jgi:hypothetical protein
MREKIAPLLNLVASIPIAIGRQKTRHLDPPVGGTQTNQTAGPLAKIHNAQKF